MGKKYTIRVDSILSLLLFSVLFAVLVFASVTSVSFDNPTDNLEIIDADVVDFNVTPTFTDVDAFNVTLFHNLTGTFGAGHPDNHTFGNVSGGVGVVSTRPINITFDLNAYLTEDLGQARAEAHGVLNFQINFTTEAGDDSFVNYGLENNSNISFTFDRVAPTAFELGNNTANATNTSSPNFNWLHSNDLTFFNYTISVWNDSGQDDINLSAQFGLFNSETNLSYNFSLTGNTLPDGNYWWTVTAWDNFSHVNATAENTEYVFTFTHDTVVPNVTALSVNETTDSPLNFTTEDSTVLNVTADDGLTGVNSVIFNVTNSTSADIELATSLHAIDQYNATLNLTELGEGVHTVTVSVNDTAGNLNATETFEFRIDTLAPNTTFIAPESFQNISSGVFNINVTAEDAVGVAAVYFNISNTTNYVLINAGQQGSSLYYNGTVNIGELADEEHQIIIFTNDTFGNLNQTETINFTSDTLAPSADVIFNVSNTTSDTLSLNVSATDTNIESVVFNVTNGTGIVQYTATREGNFFNTTVNKTELVEEIHNFTAIVNDSAGNENTTIFWFAVDSTVPTVAVTCTPSSATKGAAAIECSCAVTDTSGVLNQSFVTETKDTTETGSFEQRCEAFDTAGNGATDTATYTVTAATGGSSGGSGGGGGGGIVKATPSDACGVDAKSTKLFGRILAGQETFSTIAHEAIPVTELRFTTAKESRRVSLVVAALSNCGVDVFTPPTQEVFKYLEINALNAENSNNIKISFRVAQNWVNTNLIADDTLRLLRWNNKTWQELETTLERRDTRNIYLKANTDGFSYFAIVGQTGTLRVTEDGTLEVVPPEERPSTDAPVVEESAPAVVNEQVQLEKSSSTKTWIIVGVVIIVLLGLWWFVKGRK